MAWAGRHLKDPTVPTPLPWAEPTPNKQLAGCCFSVRILNEDSQSSRKVTIIAAEFLHLFCEKEKFICPSTLRPFCLDSVQTQKRRIMKMSQNPLF